MRKSAKLTDQVYFSKVHIISYCIHMYFEHICTRGGQKVLSQNILDYNFFTIYTSVKSASFTDSY